MIEKEITQAKQCALTTREWDTYQVIIRTCLSPHRSTADQVTSQPRTAIQKSSPDKGVLDEG